MVLWINKIDIINDKTNSFRKKVVDFWGFFIGGRGVWSVSLHTPLIITLFFMNSGSIRNHFLHVNFTYTRRALKFSGSMEIIAQLIKGESHEDKILLEACKFENTVLMPQMKIIFRDM